MTTEQTLMKAVQSDYRLFLSIFDGLYISILEWALDRHDPIQVRHAALLDGDNLAIAIDLPVVSLFSIDTRSVGNIT